jgi:hypothetical protein
MRGKPRCEVAVAKAEWGGVRPVYQRWVNPRPADVPIASPLAAPERPEGPGRFHLPPEAQKPASGLLWPALWRYRWWQGRMRHGHPAALVDLALAELLLTPSRLAADDPISPRWSPPSSARCAAGRP